MVLRDRVWKKLTLLSLKKFHKRSGGDALGLVARPGQQLEYRPVKFKSEAECDEGEQAGWHAKGLDKTWAAGSEGRVVDYLGKTPVVLLEEDSHIEAGWLKPRIAEAIELDRYDPVFANPTLAPVFEVPEEHLDIQNTDAGGGGADVALSDGGHADPAEAFQGWELEAPGMFAGDSVIDLGSGDAYDGLRISHRKADEWMAETTTTQEMQMQEDRGFLRGKMAGESGPSVVKLLIICGAIILGVLFLVLVLPQMLAGSGGGGIGGAINPLTVAASGVV
jgi:hypothetical protein